MSDDADVEEKQCPITIRCDAETNRVMVVFPAPCAYIAMLPEQARRMCEAITRCADEAEASEQRAHGKVH